MLRDHKPPPIRRIRISDFGLPDPKRDPDRHQNRITWSLSHALPLHKISSKSVHKFASNPTDRQTNRPHQKHNLLLSAEVIFQDGAILDLFGTYLNHPGRVLCGIYHCANVGCNRYSSFKNMKVWVFHTFSLKTHIHAPKIGVWGMWPLKWRAVSTNPQMAHPYASPRRLSHPARKSAHWSDL